MEKGDRIHLSGHEGNLGHVNFFLQLYIGDTSCHHLDMKGLPQDIYLISFEILSGACQLSFS